MHKEGFRTERAVEGNEALRKANALSPDLIMLDFMLPGEDFIAQGVNPARGFGVNYTVSGMGFKFRSHTTQRPTHFLFVEEHRQLLHAT